MHQPWVGFEVRSLQSLFSVPSSQVPAQQLIILSQHIATATGLLQKKMNHALNIDSVDLMCIDYKGVWAEWVMEMSAFSQHCFWRDDIEGLALPNSHSSRRLQKDEEQTKNLDVKGGGCWEIFFFPVFSMAVPVHEPIGQREGVSQMERRWMLELVWQICSIFRDAIKMASAKSLQL